MSATPKEQYFRYAFSSALKEGESDIHPTLRLATFSVGKTKNPFFFEGKLNSPRRAAEHLRAIITIVQSRFHIPAAMLASILAESDPIVTCNDGLLRFEGFSACSGAYARTDFLPAAFDGKPSGRGTTNVDFNQPMLAALARIKDRDEVKIAVGDDQLVLKQVKAEVVEKKVKLPARWMKGFVEIQAVQRRMRHVHSITGAQAFRFLRSLPRMKTHRRATYVTKSGQGLRLSQVSTAEGVRVGGLERLRVLESLAKDSKSLDIYSDDVTGASGWVLAFEDCRFHLIISPEVWRGFSGEGQALSSLAKSDKTAVAKVQATLKWQAILDVKKIARATKLRIEVVDETLKKLGARGLVGFDLNQQAYFHREMPFDISMVEKQQPRLLAARKLIEAEKVKIVSQTKNTAEVRVKSSDVEHRVSIKAGLKNTQGTQKCTCPWFNKHKNSRGPCKHILASQILLEEKLGDKT